jgi:hypothetical protein
LKYQMTKGTVAEIRDRTLRVLKGCGVEALRGGLEEYAQALAKIAGVEE